MTELRWALLLAGALFVGGLIFWELRKRRAASRQDALNRSSAQDPRNTGESAGAAHRVEPGYTPPEFPRREPVKEPQLVRIDPASDREPALGDLRVIDFGAPVSPSVDAAPGAGLPAQEWVDAAADTTPSLVVDWPTSMDPSVERRPSARTSRSREASCADCAALRARASSSRSSSRSDSSVVPRAGERFAGASLRQALVGEGFVHGEFSIFHKPLSDGRVILSAASLTRPGIFEPASMDSASFAGLNLFAVLPGPLSGRETFERLLLVGRTLAQRLRGELLDQRGQALDEARLGDLRRDAAAVPVA